METPDTLSGNEGVGYSEKIDAVNRFRGDGPIARGGSFEDILKYYDIIKPMPWASNWTPDEITELADIADSVHHCNSGDVQERDKKSASGYLALKDNKEAEEWLQKMMDE